MCYQVRDQMRSRDGSVRENLMLVRRNSGGIELGRRVTGRKYTPTQ